MNALLWILQGFFGVMFVFAGFMKATQPKEKLAERMKWAKDFSATQVKLIGTTQILGGLGLIIPWASGIEPILTPVAAVGLSLVMLFAAAYHLRHNEYKEIGVNTVIFAVTAFIAYGRF